jgi:hypothetical protein
MYSIARVILRISRAADWGSTGAWPSSIQRLSVGPSQ